MRPIEDIIMYVTEWCRPSQSTEQEEETSSIHRPHHRTHQDDRPNHWQGHVDGQLQLCMIKYQLPPKQYIYMLHI